MKNESKRSGTLQNAKTRLPGSTAEMIQALVNNVQQEKVLQSLEQHEAKGVVLDISAVETLDSFFARTVSETAQMVGLMGGRTIIAGMRPPVAVAATEIGLSLGIIETALNVDRALDMIGNQSAE